MVILVKKWRTPYRWFNQLFGRLIPIQDQEDYLSFTWLFKMWGREEAIRKEWNDEVLKVLEMVKRWRKIAGG